MEVIPPVISDTASKARENEEAPLNIGREIFGRFTLLENLGSGRCSTAWRADDPRFMREVVLKIFQSSNQDAVEAEQKIWREFLRTVRGLNQPTIAPAMEFLREGPWIALSNHYISGETLASHVRQAAKPIPLKESERILRSVGEAMVVAHEKGHIIHGNLNAYNIFLKRDGVPKIVDFGFHPPLESSLEEHQQPDSDFAWKIACVSPERRAGGAPSWSDDLYAFAAVSFQLLTGKNVPTGEGQARSESIADSLRKLPEKWQQQLAAALSENPTDRPESVKSLLEKIALVEVTKPAPKREKETYVSRKRQTPSKSRQSSRLFLLTVIFSILALGVGVAWLIRQGAADNEKLQVDRARDETIELAKRKAQRQAARDLEQESEASTSIRPPEPPTPVATPLVINSGALDFFHEGNAKFKANNPAGALESYDLALILQPAWPELLEARAAAFIALKKPDDAIGEYDEALKSEPDRPTSLLGRANVLLDLGNLDQARADFEAVLEKSPGSAMSKAGLERISQLQAAHK